MSFNLTSSTLLPIVVWMGLLAAAEPGKKENICYFLVCTRQTSISNASLLLKLLLLPFPGKITVFRGNRSILFRSFRLT